MATEEQQSLQGDGDFLKLRHDIRNQLSNIQLALAGLEFECDQTSEDLALYLSSIAESAKRIDKLLADHK
ncbi:hypothetical protein INP83_02750 [Mucilaginibacter sp. 21P]|uniref:histidine kinase dimerization/phospho-acceptor domain-containing protein n=1 Tax=Mucilaginibacter sp. 21P TaxID=2778902 RepID=UPI001C58F384|nr:histidine kinase dimerization/phospho-acceptor domain-containing protein [Mucilaginibacter sp. 21P]QXV66032.1 hypothetical protein INP83_02750 [Mucilaginibacter sp. 21P]